MSEQGESKSKKTRAKSKPKIEEVAEVKVETVVKTEAEYSAQIIKLLLSIIKWLVIAIFLIIVMFLGTVIFVLTNDNIEIEIGKASNKPCITLLDIDNNKNHKTFNV